MVRKEAKDIEGEKVGERRMKKGHETEEEGRHGRSKEARKR